MYWAVFITVVIHPSKLAQVTDTVNFKYLIKFRGKTIKWVDINKPYFISSVLQLRNIQSEF